MAERPRAIIDIGSNAIRIIIATVNRDGIDEVLHRQRAAVRLGASVFATGRIDAVTLDRATAAVVKFCALAREHGAGKVCAVATSATREAENGEDLRTRIREQTGIEIDIITGGREAELLVKSIGDEIDLRSGTSILVDLGGGSAEIARVQQGEIQSAQSYPLGALRILHALQGEAPCLRDIEQHVHGFEQVLRSSIGSEPVTRCLAVGGNIDSLARLAGTPDAIGLTDLQAIIRRLAEMPVAERVARYQLRADRADTIVPAGVVYAFLTRLAQQDVLLLPRVSIAHALIATL